MTIKYLITGATGGLGGLVLKYFVANVPLTEFAAASSNTKNRSLFESQGIKFRHLNYEDPSTLDTALEGVENMFFVSTNTNLTHVERIRTQHQNVVDAAKRAGVKHVWYTSLPFGGLTNDSEVEVQQCHLHTEKMLQNSGVTYTSIRQGIYIEAFPLFLNWFPETTHVTLPGDGEIAFVSREELAECNARLMIRGGYENKTVLLTAEETITGKGIIDVINETTNRKVHLEYLSTKDWVKTNTLNDRGNKSQAAFEILASWWESASKGDLRTTDGLMREILERSPMTPKEAVRNLLLTDKDHKWHQNYA